MTDIIVNRRMDQREWLALVLLSALWGGSFLFAGLQVKWLPPFTIVFLRVALAAVILNVLIRTLGRTMLGDAATWRAFFGMGILNNAIPFCLIVWGQGHIASGLAAILNATTPIFTVIVAHFTTSDEKMTTNRLVGVIVGFAGVAVLTGADALKGLGVDVLAELAVLLAAISYAFAGVFGRRFKRLGIDPIVTATGQASASALMLLPVVMLADTPWILPVPPMVVWLAAIGSAVFSTVLAYVLYFRILSTAGATNLSLVTFLIPVSAIVMGAVALGEHLAPRHFLGLAFIGAGLAAIDGRLLSRRKNAGETHAG
ncbi:DMT family transporter [Bradyrhizobium sp.]|uniref:DMT family transporter n=1 Tax=Bradyrhizobium sp. TaxID=376 RepID=UPI002D297AF4|nr:DMT family transporter [Bradyrhizobium sp.]HZR74245.1 DMT family transporter [Bradyrhizobium sp.]